MNRLRFIPLILSVSLVVFLLGGGLAVRVVADEGSFHQVVVFSEVLSLVLDNYVDPLEAERLLESAYEGMLAGLDVRGAYLTPEELAEWKAGSDGATAGPGFAALKVGRVFQIVAIDPGSPAAEAGLAVGDQIRKIEGRSVRELSLDQAWRLFRGRAGTPVRLDVLHATGGYRRETIEIDRAPRRVPPYELRVEDGIGLLRLLDPARVAVEDLGRELDDVASRGVDQLLIDLRNVADIDLRGAVPIAGLFASGPSLHLRDRQGERIESVRAPDSARPWAGSVTALVNGATAGSAEALAGLIQADLGGRVLGETTYGLGAEARLYELGDGSGLLVSAAVWETAAGARWNADGIEPDEVIRGQGADYEARQADQLETALESVRTHSGAGGTLREAA
jgi:carboxyl-terminal processing protease